MDKYVQAEDLLHLIDTMEVEDTLDSLMLDVSEILGDIVYPHGNAQPPTRDTLIRLLTWLDEERDMLQAMMPFSK